MSGGRVLDRLDGLVAGMGHELRSPLNVIIGFSDLLLMELPGPLTEVQRRSVTDIRSAGRALLQMADNLVELARLERGEVQAELQDSALGPIFDDVRTSLQGRAAEKGLSLDLDRSGPETCHADPRLLARILTHLVANGIAFTETGGVVVRAREHEAPRGVRVEVVDSGIGISEHDRRMLFQPFDRAAGDLTTGRQGVGLGLFISRRLADLMGAELTVETEIGRGTTCSVILPPRTER